MCQRFLRKNLGPVHTNPDIFEKRRKKTHCGVKWLRAKGTKPPLIEYHDLNVCNMNNDISPVKVRAQNTPNAISPVYTSREIKVKIQVTEDKPPLVNQQCVSFSVLPV